MKNTNSIIRFSLSILALASCAAIGRAGTIEGSSVIPREALDIAFGQVYIYAGGFFDPGVTVKTFSFLGLPAYPGFDFSGQRYITPILFEETAPNVFVVRGIGAGETVTSSGSVQSFNFNLQFGLGTTTSGLFTFGFINALVDGNGNPTATSAGTVMLKETVDPGAGLGGPLTNNDWVFTPTVPGVTVGLNQSFGRPGTTGTTFVLNNPLGGEESTDRTYSASLAGFVSSVPEPATVALCGFGLLMVGIARRRKG
jgi:PEP-CTERM motif-containing protein